MALLYVCDCGKEKVCKDKNDLIPMGVSQKLYCKGECEEKVNAFLLERDELHEKMFKQWHDGLAKLYKKHGKDFLLPDGQ